MSQFEQYKELHNKGQYKEAIDGYKALLKDDKNNDEIHFSLALSLVKLNEFNDALTHVNAAIGTQPHIERYHQFKGQVLMDLGQYDQAAKAFQTSLKENPNLFFSYLALGDIHLVNQQPDKAKNQYQLALKANSQGIPAITRTARVDILAGEYDAAYSLLQEYSIQYPDELELMVLMGMTKLEQGQSGLAEFHFRHVIDKAPDHIIAHAYYAISLIASQNEEAKKIATQLLQKQPKLPQVLAGMGLLYHHDNKHQEALHFLANAIQTGMPLPTWIMAYAKSLTMLNKADEAITLLKDQLKFGNNPQVLFLLAQIFQSKNDFTKAAYTFRSIPASSELYEQAQMKLSEVLYHMEEYENSLKVANRWLQKDPHNATAIKLAVTNLAKLNRNEQALELLQAIDHSQHPNEFIQFSYFYSGLLNDAIGQYESAWKNFSQVERSEHETLQLIPDAEEKKASAWPTDSHDADVVFLFSDTATGQHEFINWLLNNDNTVLLDRLSSPRNDVFDTITSFNELDSLDETKIHLLRKRYLKRNRTMIKSNAKKVIDCLKLTPSNAAIAKRVFPDAKVILLSRNFADFRLHNQVFGTDQIHFSQFTKVVNQMIAMGVNLTVVDIDDWKNNNSEVMDRLSQLLGETAQPYQHKTKSCLEQFMMPHMHWKHYKEMMN